VTKPSKDKDKKNDQKGKLRVKDLDTKKDPKGGPIYMHGTGGGAG
jgi:hypothetical protein